MLRNDARCNTKYKMGAHYEGPTVVRKNRGGAYILRDGIGKLKRAVHPNHLKLITRQGNKTVIESDVFEVDKILAHREDQNKQMERLLYTFKLGTRGEF